MRSLLVLRVAVGKTVISLTPPCLSMLKHLNRGTGGCHQVTVSPTASCGSPEVH